MSNPRNTTNNDLPGAPNDSDASDDRQPLRTAMERPDTHNADLTRLPAALQPLTKKKIWFNWNWEWRVAENGEGKWTKPPLNPRNLKYARVNDPNTCGSYEQAVERWRNGDADGIGFMLLNSSIGAADLDDCCRYDAKKRRSIVDLWVRELRNEASDTYCEVTVSGTGLRFIGTANGSELHRAFKIDNARAKAKIELFRNTARYITVSGIQLGTCQQLPSIDEFLDTTLVRYDQGKPQAEVGHPERRDFDNLIRNGAPQGDNRSNLFHSVVWHLASKGWSIEQIVDELARYPNGIALKFADRLQEEVTRSFKKWQDKNPAKTLPIIRCAAGQIARMVDEAEVALIDANIPIFVRGKMLVEPITVQRQAAHDRTTLVTAFSRLGERKLSYQLNKYAADFQRYDLKRKKWVLIDPPENITSALLTLRDWRFPEVVGIVNAPTMRPDGSILSELGYDPATRLWCNSDIELPPIADKPSRAQAVVALQLVKALLAGFPFVGPVDWAVALAAIQSAVLRGAFDLVPLMAILAHASGTGKSYLVDLIATIITGRKCPVITGSKSGEEMEKRLGVLLLEGSSMTSLDNLSQDIEGDLLAQMVTQNFIKPRILGKSEMPECEWRGMLFATGNNIRVVGDMIRRTLVCQLDAKLEHPEQRKFPFDAIQRILDNRGSYIAAAITIARAYAAASSPKANSTIPLNGFDSWSKVVREPLIWLGEADPVASMEAARAADPERVAAQELMTLWSKCIGVGKLVSTRSIIATANDHRFPSFRAFLIEHVGGKGDQIDSVGLGKWLQKESGRVYGNLRINVVSHRGRGNEYVMNKIDG